ncbi:hypothetical protein ACNF40_06660 [Cuniculiplasma sp. SKW4]|uniref:hypothetical protein n=1 Tax=Cuniculiplasma sp. SKW4 TaxID=3400171 RepID=UPI003FD3DA89
MTKKVLVIEDDELAYNLIKQAVEEAAGKNEISVESEFHANLEAIKKIDEKSWEEYLLVILDLKLGSEVAESSSETLDFLKEFSKQHFIPVVIYSAFLSDIDQNLLEEWKFIKVVTKASSGQRQLADEIERMIRYKIKLTELAKSLNDQFQNLSIETMDSIFADKDEISPEVVQAMMISRLTSFLTNRMNAITGNNAIPAEARIIYPPLKSDEGTPVSMGDVLKDENGVLWLVMSPTCDMVLDRGKQGRSELKIKNVLMLRCFTSMNDVEEYAQNINVTIQDNNERTIPLKVPKKIAQNGLLVVHMKLYETRPYEVVRKWVKVLSVGTPYAEDIKANFMRDIIRVGTPDTDPLNRNLISDFKKIK